MRSSSREHKGHYFGSCRGHLVRDSKLKIAPQQMYNQLQAGFLTCVLPRSSFPSGGISCRAVDQRFLDFRFYIGADAHSGATAADFNRVPVLSIPKQNAPGPAIEISPFKRAISRQDKHDNPVISPNNYQTTQHRSRGKMRNNQY